MIRLIFALAFMLGAAAVVSMSAIFVGSDVLALTVTLVIGAVYTIGTIELLQFQKATSTLSKALVLSKDFAPISGRASEKESEQTNVLENWLSKLHDSLRNAVKLRIARSACLAKVSGRAYLHRF